MRLPRISVKRAQICRRVCPPSDMTATLNFKASLGHTLRVSNHWMNINREGPPHQQMDDEPQPNYRAIFHISARDTHDQNEEGLKRS